MKMKKLTAVVLTVIMLLSMGSMGAFAVEDNIAVASGNRVSLADTADQVLYRTSEIRDIDALKTRALAGIDEFKEKTGRSVTATAAASDGINVETFTTSQLLSTALVNGEIVQEYAITAITIADGPKDFPVYDSVFGCGLTTTIYVYVANSSYRFLYSEATISAASAVTVTRLQMENHAVVDLGVQYSNSGSATNPANGRWPLSPSPSYPGSYFHILFGYIQATNTLTLSTGDRISTTLNVDYGKVYPIW